MPIRVLPPELVNQIAAGEVVERPASVVKELVENSIDAGARTILIEVEGGGAELVRITDDGGGIAESELPLAVAAHATSKVATSDDLAAIHTFGFRGEALASIASVSRFKLQSCVRGATSGAEVEVEGGAIRPLRPAPARPGTVVEVRTLFFNVPARRKFLKSDAAETARVTETVEALALSHPTVSFELRSNGRRLLDLAATAEPTKRTLDVLGAELAPELLEFEERFPELGGLVVRGFAGKPGIARPSSRAIRIHLNGRPIMDRTVLHAVREAYRGLVDPARTPTVALILELDPREVDVNVHPAKSEVRFRSQQGIHSAVRKAIERTLRAANLVPSFVPDAMRAPAEPYAGPRAPLFGSGFATQGSEGAIRARSDFDSDFSAFAALATGVAEPKPDGAAADEPVLAGEFPYIQLLNGFVVTEDADGVVIVDQHALHERAMFAAFMARLEKGALESQRLLVPIVIEKSAREVDLLAELAPLLARLGVEARAFGPRSVAVEAVPTLLHSRNADAGAFVGDLLEKAVEHGSLVSLEAALHEVVDMMACKAAVKAGDSLTAPEIRSLLAMRESIERSTACPHGRPTSIRIARGELERRFGRS
ncbi:MAG: DNA mismatch repair endonuclease MutL [Planctomycetota bacterium]|nr:DNA mismatch repair endonuclease MutL [Planctomycetota bacterium]